MYITKNVKMYFGFSCIVDLARLLSWNLHTCCSFEWILIIFSPLQKQENMTGFKFQILDPPALNVIPTTFTPFLPPPMIPSCHKTCQTVVCNIRVYMYASYWIVNYLFVMLTNLPTVALCEFVPPRHKGINIDSLCCTTSQSHTSSSPHDGILFWFYFPFLTSQTRNYCIVGGPLQGTYMYLTSYFQAWCFRAVQSSRFYM